MMAVVTCGACPSPASISYAQIAMHDAVSDDAHMFKLIEIRKTHSNEQNQVVWWELINCFFVLEKRYRTTYGKCLTSGFRSLQNVYFPDFPL